MLSKDLFAPPMKNRGRFKEPCLFAWQKGERGQTLLELVVVVAVIIVVVGALVFATIASLRNASFAKNQTQATKLAQEALERVRTGRDRNQCINNLDASVKSWNGNSSNSTCAGSGSLWGYQISGNCDRPDLTPPGVCYFNVDSTGQLNNIGFAQTSFPSLSEGIPTDNQLFRRVILLSDDTDYQNQKKVTAVVRWIDFAGTHESRLTTILRKI